MTRWMIAVGGLAFTVPALLAIVVFPTAMIDTREVFAWGRFLPLATHKHPPMMALVAGLAGRIFPATAFWAIVVGQVINTVGLAYLYLALRQVVDGDRARLATFLFATSFYFMLAPLSYALNADILQVTIWLAVVYHFIRAARTDALLHWTALALWSAAAVMTKYSVALLFVTGLIALLLTPVFRRTLTNPRFYIALILGLVVLVPHFLALRANPVAITYAENFAFGGAGLVERFRRLGNFAGGAALFMAPAWIIIAVGLINGTCAVDREPVDDEAAATRRFFLILAVSLIAITIVLALAFGSTFNHRFGTPMFALFILAAAPFITIPKAQRDLANRDITIAAASVAVTVFVVSWIVYGAFTSHNYMQEPNEEALATVQAAWREEYSCGPAYILGDRASAHGLAIAGDRHPIGVPLEDIARAAWYDPARLDAEGAIVAYRKPIPTDEIARHMPDIIVTDVRTFTLPLLRTRSDATITYNYFFIPPQACQSPGSVG